MAEATNTKIRIEAEIKQVLKYNAETLSAIDDVNNNRNMSPTFDNMEDLMRNLTGGVQYERI